MYRFLLLRYLQPTETEVLVQVLQTLADLCEDYGKLNQYQLFRYAENDYRKEHCYRTVLLRKKSGGMRTLNIPDSQLRRFQSYLLSFLEASELAEPAAAYRKGRGLREHAARHTGAAMLVKLDIEDFFGSVTFSDVFRAVDRALERSPHVGPHRRVYAAENPAALHYNNELSWNIAQFCTLDEALPQGAPTSPILSNMVFLALDKQLAAYCGERHITYTRYSDDMIFSGDFAPTGLIRFAGRLLLERGFRLNEGKTVIAGKGRQKKVTGVVVNERPQVARSYRQSIRQEIYYIGKFGLESHLNRRAALSTADTSALTAQGKKALAVSALRRLLGQIQFVLQIDPENVEFKQYKLECGLLLSSMTGCEETE